jgi:C-terminal peptidase prc
MVGQLEDDHSAFFSPQEVAEAESFLGGLQNVGGIGANFRKVEEGLLVFPFSGGPAFEAGLQPVNLVVAVDGNPITDFSSDGEITGALLGESGTLVQLTVRSPDGTEREVAVTRRAVDLGDLSVEGKVIEDTQIGLLTIDSFVSDKIPLRTRETLRELMRENSLEGLVVDLRTNQGGWEEAFFGTIGLFIDGGSIGKFVGRDTGIDVTIPAGKTMPELEGLPVVVLIGPWTQSAAEFFASGMQIRGRAVIIGMPSAGNTEYIFCHDLDDGSQLCIAERVYQLPNGTLIEGRGVQPDIVIEADWWLFDLVDDPQIKAAIEALDSD